MRWSTSSTKCWLRVSWRRCRTSCNTSALAPAPAPADRVPQTGRIALCAWPRCRPAPSRQGPDRSGGPPRTCVRDRWTRRNHRPLAPLPPERGSTRCSASSWANSSPSALGWTCNAFHTTYRSRPSADCDTAWPAPPAPLSAAPSPGPSNRCT